MNISRNIPSEILRFLFPGKLISLLESLNLFENIAMAITAVIYIRFNSHRRRSLIKHLKSVRSFFFIYL
jgi:hypothetical protein